MSQRSQQSISQSYRSFYSPSSLSCRSPLCEHNSTFKCPIALIRPRKYGTGLPPGVYDSPYDEFPDEMITVPDADVDVDVVQGRCAILGGKLKCLTGAFSRAVRRSIARK